MNFKPSIDNGPLVGTDFVIEKVYRVGRPRSDSKPRRIVARFLNYKDREAVFKAKRIESSLYTRHCFMDACQHAETNIVGSPD